MKRKETTFSISRFLKKSCIFVLLFFQLGQNTLLLLLDVNATYVNTIGIKGDFTLNSDAIKTTSLNITLNNDLTGVSEMRFGNTPAERDSASWEVFSSTKVWTLIGAEGIKTVYGEFKNPSSNTLYVSDDIIYKLDPSLPFTGGLTLWLDASDASSITQSAGNISQWSDKSGNNYHAKQNTGSRQANLLTDEVDFNGSSDYFYLQSLNYTSAAPMDGFLVCTVFRTPHITTGLSDNWAFLDFDRSEWFNFYSRGDGVGLSYDAGGIQDINVSGIGINDNNLHVACASYDNTLVNDTVITIDGTTQYSSNLEAPGSQIGVGQATRYGFVGDGSEANTENGSRNARYYDGGMNEMVYYDSAVIGTDRKDVECYLGDKWGVIVAGCPADSVKPIASVSYLPGVSTSSDVVAMLDTPSEIITVTNNSGALNYTFTSNGTFTFEFQDASGNTGSTLAKVDWIDPAAPPAVGTGSLNDAPTITSYSGASSVSIDILSGATDVATIAATDTAFNVIGEYGKATLGGNSWLSVNTYEMCSPAVVVSHRGDVSGETQRAPRVRNKTGTGFQVHVDNYNSTIGAIATDIDYIVMSSGSYDFGGGLIFEAGTKTTSAVACNASSSPAPQTVNFASSFTFAPVVLHTISTENDANWVVSGVNGDDGTRQSEPTTIKMGTVLQRSFNSCTHASEDLDYIAFEAGNYSLTDGSILDAVRSTDSIASITGGGNPITFNTAFSSAPQTVLVSQLGEDGGNGGYTQIHTGGPQVTVSQVFATIDEDGPGADRNHTQELASSVAFDKTSGQFWEENTITYSIIGGTDAADFTIHPNTGVLSFITGKSPASPTDSNTDNIYEVIIEARDSHCNSKIDTQTILVQVIGDITPPVITSTNIPSGSLLPGGNHNIVFNYNDTHTGSTGVDTASENIVLEKWDGASWIVSGGISNTSTTITVATYATSNLSYGKYRATFHISDNAGNVSFDEVLVFYIDQPEFIVSTGSLDIGVVGDISNSFSPEITITVKTVGAGFDVLLNKNTTLTYSGETISDWDGSIGFGYDQDVYTGNISLIGVDENIGTQATSINTDGNLNTYTYKIKLGAIINSLQAGGDYSGSINFSINLDY